MIFYSYLLKFQYGNLQINIVLYKHAGEKVFKVKKDSKIGIPFRDGKKKKENIPVIMYRKILPFISIYVLIYVR